MCVAHHGKPREHEQTIEVRISLFAWVNRMIRIVLQIASRLKPTVELVNRANRQPDIPYYLVYIVVWFSWCGLYFLAPWVLDPIWEFDIWVVQCIWCDVGGNGVELGAESMLTWVLN